MVYKDNQNTNNQKLEDIASEVSNPNSNIYSHGVFGCFGIPGHYLQETIGNMPSKKMRQYTMEKDYTFLFDNEGYGIEFNARVSAEKVEEGTKFCLSFNDRRGDKRGGSHTDYLLIIPESKAEVITAIKSDPSLLIKIFQKVFPNYDRSNGTLRMHETKSYLEAK
jgi:hypothetical protein